MYFKFPVNEQPMSTLVRWAAEMRRVNFAVLPERVTAGDLFVALSNGELARLPDVEVGNVLLSGGLETAPSYGKVDITSMITGIMPVANGGTGVSSLAQSTWNVIGVVDVGSISAEILEQSWYLQVGKLVFINSTYVWTQATAAANTITINLPVQPAGTNQILSCLMNVGTAQPLPATAYVNSTTGLGTVICYPPALGVIPVGNVSVQLQGFYFSS